MRTKAKYAWIAFCAVLAMSVMLGGSGSVPSGTWGPTGSLSAVRDGASAVALPDGRVLVIGGANGSGVPSASVDAYAGGSFSAVASMHIARKGASAILLKDGRVLVAGGSTLGGAPTGSAEIYDPAANSWSYTGNLSVARSGATIGLAPDGCAVVAGGSGASGALASVEVWNSATETFSVVGSMSSARANAASASIADGRILIVGGSGANGQALASSSIYDHQSNKIDPGPNMSAARSGASATSLVNGNILVAGGSGLASAEIYSGGNGTQGSFSATGSMSAPRTGAIAVRLANNNGVLVVGGGSASAEVYQSWSGSFVTTGSPASAHAGGSSAGSAEGEQLVAGGSGSSSAELYGFATVKTDKYDYLPGETAVVSGSGWTAGEPVTLVYHEDVNPPIHPDVVNIVLADVGGNISDSYLLEAHDRGVTYYLSASGGASGFQAQIKFTDAPSADLDQCQNGDSDPVAIRVNCNDTNSSWVNGNAGAQNSHYVEGYSIPYRLRMEQVPQGGDIDLWLGYDIKHSGGVAIDDLTHFQCLEPHAPFGHAAEDVDPTNSFGGYTLGAPTSTFLIPAPNYSTAPGGTNPTGGLNDCPNGRTFTMWGGTITDVQYTAVVGSSDPAQGSFADSVSISSTTIRIRFTPLNANVLLSWGGHIASRVDWGMLPDGTPRSAGGISGSPYHMRMEDWRFVTGGAKVTNLGNTDRSLSAAAVIPTSNVTIVKEVDPGTSTQNFTFSVTGAVTSGFDLDDDGLASPVACASGSPDATNCEKQNVIQLIQGNQIVVTESDANSQGFTLSQIMCTATTGLTANQQSTIVTNLAGGFVTITVQDGEDITCTFTNVPRGHIIVDKVTVPSGDTQSFAFDAVGSGYNDFNLTDAAAPNDQSLVAGNYSVTETVPSGWDLTSVNCVSSIADSEVNTALELDAGETITCTFTNTKRGSIKIIKDAVPDDPQNFAYTSTSNQTTTIGSFNLDDDGLGGGDAACTGGNCLMMQTFSNLKPGNYTVTETLPVSGWALTNLVCNSTGSGTSDSENIGTGVSTITLGAGGSVECTYTNTKQGKVIVVKHMIGGTDTFSYTGNPSGSISANDGMIMESVAPGSYESVEGAKAGWALYSISCDDSDSTGDVGTRTASFEVAAGETVTCTFTNIKPDAQIDLSPLTATNEVNHAHTITATVQQDDMLASGAPGGDSATGFGPAPDGTLVTFSLLNNTAGATFVGAINTCTTTGGTCSVQINTSTAGGVDIHATTTFSVLSISLTRATGTGGLNSADAHKTYVDAQIDLSPLNATNNINQAHTITATVQQDDGIPAAGGGDGVTGFGPAPNGTLVTFSLLNNTAGATFVGGVNTCTTTAGTCSVQINTSTPGSVDIHATTTFLVGGVSLTRATGTGGLNSADAHKVYVAGNIIVIKECEPANDPQLFTFSGPGAISGAQLACFTNGHSNNVDSGVLAPGNYNVEETVPAGWDLTSVTCDDDDGTNPRANPAALVLQANETITCTFHNVKRGKLVVRKINLGRGPAFPFFGYFGDPTLPDAMAGSIGIVNNSPVAPHTNADFSLQTQPANADPNQQCLGIFNASQFATAECKGEAMVPGLAPGTQTFFEQQPSSLTWRLIQLVCTSDDPNDTTQTSINDTDGVVNGTPAKGGRVDLDVDPGETITCTFVNQFGGRIRVVKQTDPAGDSQSFHYDTNYLNPGPGSFDLTDADVGDGNDTDPNTAPPSPNNLSDWQPPSPDANHYMVTETVPSGWDLTGLSCYIELGPNAGNTVGVVDLGNNKVTVPLSGGQIVRCTFSNTKQGKIIVHKDISFGDVNGGPFPFDATGFNDFNLSDDGTVNHVTGGVNQDTFMIMVPPGPYSVQELVANAAPAGTWAIDDVTHPNDAISCSVSGTGTSATITGAVNNPTNGYQSGDDKVNITLGAAGQVECTYINRLGGKIKIVKVTNPSPDASNTMFEFDPDYVRPTPLPVPNFFLKDGEMNLSLWQPVTDAVNGTTYHVQEVNLPQGWSLTGLVCDDSAQAPPGDGSNPSTVDLGTATATIHLDAGETVTCTYTDTLSQFEGCTPGFWKNHSGLGNGPQANAWPAPYSDPNTLLSSVFTIPQCLLTANPKFGTDSLFQALSYKGGSGVNGGAQILFRAAVAALLNAASPDVDYPLTTQQVIDQVNAAIANCDRSAMITLAGDLDAKNNLGCPINGRSTGIIVGTLESAPTEVPDTSGTTNMSSATTTSKPASKPVAAVDNPAGLGLGVIPAPSPTAAPETAEKELSQITSVKLAGNQVEASGRVVDSSGAPLSGVVGITFAFYSEKEGGAPVWLETRNVQLDEEGRYTVRIALPAELGTLESHWLGAQVQGQAEQLRVVLR